LQRNVRLSFLAVENVRMISRKASPACISQRAQGCVKNEREMEKMLARQHGRAGRESAREGETKRTKRNPKSGHFCRNGGDTYIEMPRRRGRGVGDCTNETREALFWHITLWLWYINERCSCVRLRCHTHTSHAQITNGENVGARGTRIPKRV